MRPTDDPPSDISSRGNLGRGASRRRHLSGQAHWPFRSNGNRGRERNRTSSLRICDRAGGQPHSVATHPADSGGGAPWRVLDFWYRVR